MRAVILAAGSGSRLGPAAEGLPKALLPVAGRALIDHQLAALGAAGITDIIVVAGYRADLLAAHLAGRCRVVVNEDYATTNSIVSLHRAAAHLAGDGFVMQNGDVLYVPALVRRLVAVPRPNACLVDPFRPWSASEYQVEVSDGWVTRYSREVAPERSVGESAQLVRVGRDDSPAFLERIAAIVSAGGHEHFPNQAYDRLVHGSGLWPVFTAGLPWWEIDTPEDYALCRDGIEAAARVPDTPPPLGARFMSLLREPRVPQRLALLGRVVTAMPRHPACAIRSAGAVVRGQLTPPGLDLQLHGRAVLSMVLSEARRVGLEPMLLWGTLLGCVREGRFIRNDHDLDLGVFESERDRLGSLRDALRRHGFEVRLENAFKLSLTHRRHSKLFVDVDVIHRWKDGWAITNAGADPRRAFRYRFGREVFEGAPAVRRLEGLPVRVPHDPVGFLSAVYGDWERPATRAHYLYAPLNLELELRPHPAG